MTQTVVVSSSLSDVDFVDVIDCAAVQVLQLCAWRFCTPCEPQLSMNIKVLNCHQQQCKLSLQGDLPMLLLKCM
jgi:hypothetical protein